MGLGIKKWGFDRFPGITSPLKLALLLDASTSWEGLKAHQGATPEKC